MPFWLLEVSDRTDGLLEKAIFPAVGIASRNDWWSLEDVVAMIEE